jgi:transcriptional regulator with XRE-family HTH domain
MSTRDRFPNSLMRERQAKGLTREELSVQTRALAASDVNAAVVTVAYLQKLERGISMPRKTVAETLSRVLQREVAELFPAIREGSNNPAGRPFKVDE